MGFWDRVKANVGGAISSVQGEWDKFQRQDDVRAMLAVMALVAGADGEIEAEERAAGVTFLKSGNVFKGFDRTYLEKTITEFYDKATSDFLREDLYDEIKGIADEVDTRKAVIRAGIAMAGADGEIEPAEKDVLRQVCTLLGEDVRSYPKIAA